MIQSIGISFVLAAIAWGQAPQVTTDFSCAADLGVGVKSRRKFCDVLISTDPRQGVTMTLLPHAGTATLRFDLHNRFTPPTAKATPAEWFAKHTAVVAVLGEDGRVIGRAAVSRELRNELDVFDRIAGGIGPGGVIAVAPGRAEGVTLVLPAGVTSIAVVGVSLEATSLTEQGTFETPGRPVAVGSNFRIEYQRKQG